MTQQLTRRRYSRAFQQEKQTVSCSKRRLSTMVSPPNLPTPDVLEGFCLSELGDAAQILQRSRQTLQPRFTKPWTSTEPPLRNGYNAQALPENTTQNKEEEEEKSQDPLSGRSRRSCRVRGWALPQLWFNHLGNCSPFSLGGLVLQPLFPSSVSKFHPVIFKPSNQTTPLVKF